MRQAVYQLWTQDQPDLNWLTRVVSEQGEYGMRMRYTRLTCKGCGRFALDDVFAEGFDPHVRIKVKKGRNVLVTDDYFPCVTWALLERLTDGRVAGFEHKPLPETDWHVLRITERRPFDQSVYKTEGRRCAVCGRQGEYRTIELARQIEAPQAKLTFFSTDRERGQGGYDLFVTGLLIELLKEAGLKGATFRKLLSDEEEREAAERRAKQPNWRPKGSAVVL